MDKKGYSRSSEGDNRKILMLLSAFHVSTPTLVYKHWLNGALHHLFHVKEIASSTYLSYLESLAKAFVFDRFLATAGGTDYFDMIYRNKGICQARPASVSEESLNSRLTFGNIENNLVFNFLDYLLWLELGATERVKSYEFTFRSSVEHYYSQHPMPGHDPLPSEAVNAFGNLCLISHSKNSRLSNFMPKAKKEYYQNNPLDSVKQYVMMTVDRWDAQSIAQHDKAMKNVLLKSLEDGRNA
jgi:hypothetical protein